MNEAKPGARLAGRYRLTERLSVSPDDSSWRAVDETLDRPVSVWVLRPGHPFADDVLDSARRAALIEDRRLVTVLGVGTDSGTQGDRAFVVTEAVEGRTLEQLTQNRPLSGAGARRIAGETSEGLAIASERGLHHLRLTPAHVIVTDDGAVKIFGLAVLAAAAGMDPGHATRANRADAKALVALLYSALTGRWPLADVGFPPAERTAAGTPVPPRQVVPDVPSDLNRLCAATFSGGGSPASPDQVALALTPWPSATDAGLVSTERGSTRSGGPVAPVPALKPVPRTPRSGMGRPGTRPSSVAPTARPTSGPIARVTLPGEPPAARRRTPPGGLRPVRPATPAPVPDRQPEPRFRPAPPALPPAAAGPATPGLGPTPHPSGEIDLGDDPRRPRPELRLRAPSATPRPTPDQAPDQARDSRGPDTPSGPARLLRSPVVNAAPLPVERADPAEVGRRTAHPAPVESTGEQLMPWASTWTDKDQLPSSLESTGPFPLVLPQRTPPPRQSGLVIVVILTVIVLVVGLAAYSLRTFRLNIGGGDGVTPTPPVATGSATPGPTPGATPATTGTGSTSGPNKPQVAAIRAIDPQGDGDEDTADSPKAVDGDAGTAWNSQTYATAQFGGLKKGLGLAIRLKKKAAVTAVQVDVTGSGGTVQLRLGPTANPADATVVAAQSTTGGTVTLRPGREITSRYVILWFTRLPRTGDGYRAEVSEVRVT